eukprot:SAG31_NODE_1033_length_10230_cov_15.289014_2_plen_71_part_00
MGPPGNFHKEAIALTRSKLSECPLISIRTFSKQNDSSLASFRRFIFQCFMVRENAFVFHLFNTIKFKSAR